MGSHWKSILFIAKWNPNTRGRPDSENTSESARGPLKVSSGPATA